MNKKEQILASAIKLFSKNGFGVTRTAQIATDAGVAEGTIFRHFMSKINILHTIISSIAAVYIQRIDEVLTESGNSLDILDKLIDLHVSFADSNADEIRILLRYCSFDLTNEGTDCNAIYSLSSTLLPRISRVIERGCQEGSLKSMEDSQRSALVIYQLCIGVLHHYTILGQSDKGSVDEAKAMIHAYLSK